MKEFRVRTALEEDLARVVVLERAAAEAPHWAESEYAAMVDVSVGEYVRRRLFVAEAEGALIGFAVGKVMGDLAELESVAVDLQARRCGVGAELCRAVIKWCEEKGAAAVELEVRAASGGAIGLYCGLGFVAVGQRPGYYSGPVDDALRMRLDLEEVSLNSLAFPQGLKPQ